MSVRKQIKSGRKSRRENGNARPSKIWNVRGVEDVVQSRIRLLATALNASQANVIDLATKLLLDQFTGEENNSDTKCKTLSPTAEIYLSLLVRDKTPSNDPKVIELEKRILERCEARDEMMGRKHYGSNDAASDSQGGQ